MVKSARGNDGSETELETEGIGSRGDDGTLSLRIVQGELVTTHALPSTGDVVLGRGRDAAIFIDDPSLSRRHAIIHMGPPVVIEDCGSANGTRVGDVALGQGSRAPIGAGTMIALGNVRAFVQRGTVERRAARLWPHRRFEDRVKGECERADPSRSRFAVARVLVLGDVGAREVEEILLEMVRTGDLVARAAPDEYELFFPETGRPLAAGALQSIASALTAKGAQVRVGLAVYPTEARTAEELSSSALADAEAHAVDLRSGVAGGDREIDRLRALIDRVAPATIPVLLFGETGVGKEVIAKAIHAASPRVNRPFVRLNCASFSEHLLESELFGHEKGSFTGAHQAKSGLLEVADGGTVFLDEIGELPLSMQAKLLRVFEERAVLRVGGLSPRPVDVRFVAATNRDLEQEIAAGRFRRDLFFRLNGVLISIRPLRERLGEIAGLCRDFIAEASRDARKPRAPALSDEALELLRSHAWPGNVRELRNVMARAVLLCDGDVIRPEQLPLERMTPPAAQAPPPSVSQPPPASLRDHIASVERDRLLDALQRCAGNQTQAAKMLGISRGTLIARLDAFDVPRPRKR